MLMQHSFANIRLFRLFETTCHQVTQDLRTYFKYCTSNYVFNMTLNFVSHLIIQMGQSSPLSVLLFCSCDKVYQKLGQIVTGPS